MKNNGRKIKRYNNIYSRNTPGKIFIKTLSVLVLIAVAGGIGWSLYPPIYNMIVGDGTEEPKSSSSESSPQPEQENIVVDPDNTLEETTQPAVTQSPVEHQFNLDSIKYLTVETVTNPTALTGVIEDLKSQNITAVNIQIKANGGNVYIPTDIALGQQAIQPEAEEYLKGIETLKSAGFTIVGTIDAFDDNLAAKQITDEAIYYQNSGVPWIDRSVANGGTQWLNPYSPKAGEYITDLAVEAVELGVDVIVYTSFHFPKGEALESANYGAVATTTKSEALGNLGNSAKTAIEAVGGKMYIHVYGVDILYPLSTWYGGEITQVIDENLWLDMSLIGITSSMDPVITSESILNLAATVNRDSSVVVINNGNIVTGALYTSSQIEEIETVAGTIGFKEISLRDIG